MSEKQEVIEFDPRYHEVSFGVQSNPYVGGFDLHLLFKPCAQDAVYAPIRIEMVEIDPYERAPAPGEVGFQVGGEEAQHLMDSLWRAGLRPTDYRDTDGEVAAQKQHIDDLRKVLDFHLALEE